MATVTEIMKLARRLAQAEDQVETLRSERDRLIVEAHAQGESPKVLATAGAISEQQVFKILRAAKKGV